MSVSVTSQTAWFSEARSTLLAVILSMFEKQSGVDHPERLAFPSTPNDVFELKTLPSFFIPSSDQALVPPATLVLFPLRKSPLFPKCTHRWNTRLENLHHGSMRPGRQLHERMQRHILPWALMLR